MFSNCSSLSSLPDISKWNTKNLKNFKFLLSDCISLLNIPDLSKWNNFNGNDINKSLDYNKIEETDNINVEYITSSSSPEAAEMLNNPELFEKKIVEQWERLNN